MVLDSVEGLLSRLFCLISEKVGWSYGDATPLLHDRTFSEDLQLAKRVFLSFAVSAVTRRVLGRYLIRIIVLLCSRRGCC